VLDGLPAHAHGIWHPIEPCLHCVEDPFVVSRPPRSRCDAAVELRVPGRPRRAGWPVTQRWSFGCKVDPGGQVGSATQRWSSGCKVYPAGHSSATSVTSGIISCESGDENDMAGRLPRPTMPPTQHKREEIGHSRRPLRPPNGDNTMVVDGEAVLNSPSRAPKVLSAPRPSGLPPEGEHARAP
jgi:hypothetical protein